MNDIDKIDQRILKEQKLKDYDGMDKVVHAEEKRLDLEELRKNRPAFSAQTGIPMLDECLDGMRKGQLVVVSGPPKHGKTSLCQTFTKRFIEQGHQCLWFSYEMGYEELFEKFPMQNLDFYLPSYLETGNVDWIEDKIIESKQKYNTEIVFIDHLDFLRDTNILKGINLNLSTYVGGIVQKIKRIAVEQNVIIFLMSHIKKENWAGKELPGAELVRDSGQIVQLADILLMVMRRIAKRDAIDIYDGNEAMVGVMANRHNGKTKKIPLILVDGEFKEKQFFDGEVYKKSGSPEAIDDKLSNYW